MPTIAELLPHVPLRDAFNRANESPMVHAGWTKLPWDVDTGEVNKERWRQRESPSGAYWSAASFDNPAVIAGPLWTLKSTNWIFYLWAAVNPATQSGYRLTLDPINLEGTLTVVLDRVAKGVVTNIASFSTNVGSGAEPYNTQYLFAVTVFAGKVAVWRQKVGEGWVLLKEVADTTFTSGYCGVESKAGSILAWDAFYAGDIAGVVPVGLGVTTISGVPLAGEVLETTNGEWEEEPEGFAYQWQCGESEEGPWVDIEGATNPTFELTAEEEGCYIRCVVTALDGLQETEAEGSVVGPIEGFVEGTLGEPHGFPDWQPWLARQPTPLYASAGVVVKGETTIGPLYVGGAAGVEAFLLQTAGEKAFKVEVIWHVGPELVEPYIVESLYLHPTAAELHQQLPSEADHLTLRFVPLAAGGEATYRVLIQAIEDLVAERRLAADVLLSVPAKEVAKEGTTVLTLGRTAPGPARLAVAGSGEGAGRTVTLEQLNSQGEWVRYLGFPLAAAGALTTASIDLPAGPLRVTLGNTTGAAIVVDLALGVG